MRLLICSINFYPELTSTGKYTGEAAQWLAEKGIDVRVITAPPYYPAWRVLEGHSSLKYRVEILSQNLKVYRCPLWVPSQPTGLKRLLHLFSFALSSLPVLLLQICWRPSVVMTIEPPLFASPGCLLLSKICSSKSWLHIQDYEVDAAFNLGILKGDYLRRIVSRFERFLMQSFDRVSSITPAMLRLAEKKGVDLKNLIYFPNWVNLEKIRPIARDCRGIQDFLAMLKIPTDAFVGLYAGNIGNKQGIDVIVEAARKLIDKTNIYFVFCGSGSGLHELKQRGENLRNTRFLDVQPIEKFAALLGMASVHFLPQKADIADLVMPSKLTGMMASGRPVIATAEPGTSVADAVEGCGFIVPPGNVDAFCESILALEADKILCENMGRKAREWAELNLNEEKILNSLRDNLIRIVEIGA